MSDIILQVEDAGAAAALELSDAIQTLDGVESVQNVEESAKSRFGIETAVIAWIIVVTVGRGAQFLARVAYELRRRFSHGVVIDLTGERPVVTSLRDTPVARGVILVKSRDGENIQIQETEELKGIESTVETALKMLPGTGA